MPNDVRSMNYNGNESAIKLSVDLYQSDHGIVSVVNGNPDCMPAVTGGTANGAGYLVNPEYYGVHELIPLKVQLVSLIWVVVSVVMLMLP